MPANFFQALKLEIPFGHAFPVKIYAFITGKNNRCANVKHAAVAQAFDNYFESNAIQVAATESDNWFLMVAHRQQR